MANPVDLRLAAMRPQKRRSLNRTMYWDANLPRDLVEQLWSDPRLLLARGKILQSKKRCVVVRLDHSPGPFLFKHHHGGGLFRTLSKSLRRTQAIQSWLDGRYLHAAGIPTPLPRACLEQSVGPLGVCSYLLTEYVAGISLYRFMRGDQLVDETVQSLARQVAYIWQNLVDLRVSHNDLKPENLLIDLTGRLWLIDLERMRRHRHSASGRRRHAEDVARLLHPRNWRKHPWAAEVFRQQLLRTPAGKDNGFDTAARTNPFSKPLPAFNSPAQLVSVLIPCLNDADLVSDCIESVRDIADEIIVADLGSNDSTLNIVRRIGGCRILRRAHFDEAQFESWAAQQARHPWILRLLPQERLSPELAKQIQDTLAKEPDQHAFDIVPRRSMHKNHQLDRAFQCGASLRLYRKVAAQYEMRNGQLTVVVARDKIGRLSAPLIRQFREMPLHLTALRSKRVIPATFDVAFAR